MNRKELKEESLQKKKGLPIVFVLASSLVFLLPLSAIIVLHLPFVQQRLLNSLIANIQSATNLEIQMLSYRWLPFSGLELHGIKVNTGGKRILECESAHLSYSLSFSWPYLLPNELFLDKPFLHLEKNRQGHWVFPGEKGYSDKPQAGDGTKNVSIPWPRLRISSGVITAQQEGNTILSIKNVSGTLSISEMPGTQKPVLKLDLSQLQEHISGVFLYSINIAQGRQRVHPSGQMSGLETQV